jgi:site-specific DNA-methyltransferase (adenine-specific)
MKQIPQPQRFTLLRGDALSELEALAAESVHAVICDPPYGLTQDLDLEQMLRSWLKGETFVNDANGYAGVEWDNSVPGPDLWREAFRVLAPGGFLLAFAAARTVGLTQVAIQLAGFEPRDLITWVYAPGRPTSRDLGRVATEYGDDELAEQLSGHRTTMRPGHEPIFVARKPFDDKDVLAIENVIDFGVGALNHGAITGRATSIASNVWLIHDTDCVEGNCSCHLACHQMAAYGTHLYPSASLGCGALQVAKPTRAERPVGVDGITHETVKPLLLMRRLIEAVTREGQTVLDPFLGSGTTAEAALQCGRMVVGCEREARYWPLIEARIARFEKTRVAKSPVRRGSCDVQTTSVRQRPMPGQLQNNRANPGETIKRQTRKKEKTL